VVRVAEAEAVDCGTTTEAVDCGTTAETVAPDPVGRATAALVAVVFRGAGAATSARSSADCNDSR
jgi:hypothetical protein